MVAGIAGVLGLLVGSFLNVVIHRLPKMMERQWAAEVAQYALDTHGTGTPGAQEENVAATPDSPAPAAPAAPAAQPFNLSTPRSRCPSCGHVLRWYENIPVFSYLFLRGRCAGCNTRISPRYPAVELLTGALFFYCGYRWGPTATAAVWCGFSAALVALAFIDWDTTLLPDDITLPLLWAGLVAAALRWIDVPLQASVIGAACGYLALWSVYWAFKLATGKEGMGYGDFKLFAALGAWFGWEALVPMILVASVIGALVGIAMKFASSLREGLYVPFGPFLAGAGVTAMVVGPARLMQTILRWLGL
ncbi:MULTISPECIES: prepilin peptidase [unclassified Acidovorax]|uniref:prepilin peptidase n=1 Tax=unclassified Acidovorax TaxID=2684926 RepID=UPI0038579259